MNTDEYAKLEGKKIKIEESFIQDDYRVKKGLEATVTDYTFEGRGKYNGKGYEGPMVNLRFDDGHGYRSWWVPFIEEIFKRNKDQLEFDF